MSNQIFGQIRIGHVSDKLVDRMVGEIGFQLMDDRFYTRNKSLAHSTQLLMAQLTIGIIQVRDLVNNEIDDETKTGNI